jgi:uncharacterized protein DUF6883
MKLPTAGAIVDDAKIRDYLLSPEHPVGRFKAVFFGILGYKREDWQRLRQDLLTILELEDAVARPSRSFGQKYEVRGTLQGSSGRRAEVVTVWIVLSGESSPRFVTAIPG